MYLVTIYDNHNDNVGTVIHSPYVDGVKLSSGSINLVIHGISDMTFTINPSNPSWGKIKPLQTLIKVVNFKTGKVVFDGRVLKPKQKMSSSGMLHIEYTCESKLAYLNDSSQRHGEYHNVTVKDFLEIIIDNHNQQVEPHKQFIVGNVNVTTSTGEVYRYLGYEKTYATIKDKLIDRLGGYLVIREEPDGTYLDYLEEVGEYKSTPIQLRTNLKDMQKEIDPLEVITRLVPLGERIESQDEQATDASQARLTIESVNNGIDYLDDLDLQKEFGIIEGSMTWDDITQPNILKTRGQQFLNSQKAARINYELTPVDLSLIDTSFDSFECGNHHKIVNPLFAIEETLQIISKKIDINNPQNDSLTIGEKFRTLSEYQAQVNKKIRAIENLEHTVSRQSQRISNLLQQIDSVNDEMGNVLTIINDSDLEQLPTAISALEQAITNLNDTLDGIPIYDLVTPTTDGLMSFVDKNKLDLIQVLNNINLDDLKAKLDLLTITQSIDLDELYNDVQDLKNGI